VEARKVPLLGKGLAGLGLDDFAAELAHFLPLLVDALLQVV
jgi:hypothetical protein